MDCKEKLTYLEIFKSPALNNKTQKQDTGQILSLSNETGDQTSNQTNSEETRQDMGEQVPD